jgi:galactokinase
MTLAEPNPGDLHSTQRADDQEQDNTRVAELRQAFFEHFGAGSDFVARAPGRINLIGEHTDYNGGFVLPVAINRTVLIAARAVQLTGHQIEVNSQDYNSTLCIDLDKLEAVQEEEMAWSNYLRGTAWGLREKGALDLNLVPSAQFMIDGNVPRGAGLSSSAAIEVATALAFYTLAGFVPREIDRPQLALACQKGENDFIGVKSGIMDQFVSALGQPDSALLIDTRSLEYRAIPLGFQNLKLKLVAVDSAVPHSLKSSAYNERRAQCEEASRILARRFGLSEETAQLRDFSLAQLEEAKGDMSEVLFKRARHVISENERVMQAVSLLESGFANQGDLQAFGELLNQSHASLRSDYEVSVEQVDLLVDLAQKHPGVIGARMTGGGFGGCTVNVVEESALTGFRNNVVEEYRQRTGLDARMFVFEGVEGGSVLR